MTACLRTLSAIPITPEAFDPFGQVIFPQPDDTPFGPQDAQLELRAGTPRFYLMTLEPPGLQFHRITRHHRCTQCLGALGGAEWAIAVAPPGPAKNPDPEAICGFQIPGHAFIKLHRGTWHAGPLFTPMLTGRSTIDFYNLELSDTNLVDHDTCDLAITFGVKFTLGMNLEA